ncbi:hypothetical protein QQP08_007587 [Theobroma cacao]|nr:hypothetical protein QQP08_007587 [Theobroma cacao]
MEEGGSCYGLFGDLGGLKIEESVICPFAFSRFQCPSKSQNFCGFSSSSPFEEKEDGECMCVQVSEVKAKLSFVCCEKRPGLQSWRDPTRIPVPDCIALVYIQTVRTRRLFLSFS